MEAFAANLVVVRNLGMSADVQLNPVCLSTSLKHHSHRLKVRTLNPDELIYLVCYITTGSTKHDLEELGRELVEPIPSRDLV